MVSEDIKPGTAVLCMCCPDGHGILCAEDGTHWTQNWKNTRSWSRTIVGGKLVREQPADFDTMWAQIVAQQLVNGGNE